MSIPKPITLPLKSAIENVLEAANPWSRYKSLENNNNHSENIVHMAKHVGDKDDVAKAKAILARHEREGYLSPDNEFDRDKLSDKLWPKFRAAYAPK